MKLNDKVKTGILFALALIVFLAINSYALWFILFALASIIGFFEAEKLFKSNGGFMFLLLSIALTYFSLMPVLSSILGIVAYLSYMAYKQENLKNVLPLLYAGLGIAFIFEVYLRYEVAGFIWLLLIVVLCDSFAYFCGKAFGKTKFCKTSPNKTLEGVVCGVVISTVVSSIYASYILPEIKFIVLFGISLAVAFISVFGDLFESYLKRLADVKDSGTLFPGHGGVLDRVDALIFASVAMVFFV